MTAIALSDWLIAMTEATTETAEQSLGLSCHIQTVSPESGSPPLTDLMGSFISLVCEADTVQIGLVSNKENLKSWAKAMLGMTPEEEISDDDVADAVREIINIVAGGVKRRLNDSTGGMQLGLPMFVEGKVAYGDSQETASANMNLGDVTAQILVTRKKV